MQNTPSVIEAGRPVHFEEAKAVAGEAQAGFAMNKNPDTALANIKYAAAPSAFVKRGKAAINRMQPCDCQRFLTYQLNRF